MLSCITISIRLKNPEYVKTTFEIKHVTLKMYQKLIKNVVFILFRKGALNFAKFDQRESRRVKKSVWSSSSLTTD